MLLLLLARPAGTMVRCMLVPFIFLALCTAAFAASWPAGGEDFKEAPLAAVLAANTQLKGSRYVTAAARTHQLQESASTIKLRKRSIEPAAAAVLCLQGPSADES